jgi:FkbM family methyltransferase
VVAIEPHPRNYDILAVNCRGPKYKLIRMAASSAPGEMVLSGFASNMGATKIVQAEARPQAAASNVDAVPPIPVKVQRLDDMIAIDAAVDAIKIDVEGHELQVLQGATRILEQRPIIIFEQIAWDTASADETAASFLEKLGHKFITLKANDPLEPGSKLQKMLLLASSIAAGPKMSAKIKNTVSREETFPCIVALHPGKYSVDEGLLCCFL